MNDQSGAMPKEMTVDYRPRLIDPQLERHLAAFGGVVLEGPKWCGKTWTGWRHTASSVMVQNSRVRRLADVDPEDLLTGERPMLVDEWQDSPGLWDVARQMIDVSVKKGLFIFTGSAVPPRDATKHTGTGRFARLRMRPMSLFEMGHSKGVVSLGQLLAGYPVKPAASKMVYKNAIRLICRGGWPGSLTQDDDKALLIPGQYLKAIAESDLERLDGVVRDPVKVEAVLRSLARNTATLAKATTIQADVASMDDYRLDVTAATVRRYISALERVFVIDDLPAWRYSLRSKTQLMLSPKRHFTDPSLAVAALQATPDQIVRDPETAGLLFESMCVRDLRAYSEANLGRVFHYRDTRGLEADAIVVAPGGIWGAVEVKLGMGQEDEAAASLLKLKEKLAGEVSPPAFLMIVTAVGGAAFTRDDGVHVVPIDCLGP